jgi:hypothetical protein
VVFAALAARIDAETLEILEHAAPKRTAEP